MTKSPQKKPKYNRVQCSFTDLEGKTLSNIRNYAGGCKFRVDGIEHEIYGANYGGAVLVKYIYEPS